MEKDILKQRELEIMNSPINKKQIIKDRINSIRKSFQTDKTHNNGKEYKWVSRARKQLADLEKELEKLEEDQRMSKWDFTLINKTDGLDQPELMEILIGLESSGYFNLSNLEKVVFTDEYIDIESRDESEIRSGKYVSYLSKEGIYTLDTYEEEEDITEDLEDLKYKQRYAASKLGIRDERPKLDNEIDQKFRRASSARKLGIRDERPKLDNEIDQKFRAKNAERLLQLNKERTIDPNNPFAGMVKEDKSTMTFRDWFNENDIYRKYIEKMINYDLIKDAGNNFDNYAQLDSEISRIGNLTAQDIFDRADLFDSEYSVATIDRELAFRFASEQLSGAGSGDAREVDIYNQIHSKWLGESKAGENMEDIRLILEEVDSSNRYVIKYSDNPREEFDGPMGGNLKQLRSKLQGYKDAYFTAYIWDNQLQQVVRDLNEDLDIEEVDNLTSEILDWLKEHPVTGGVKEVYEEVLANIFNKNEEELTDEEEYALDSAISIYLDMKDQGLNEDVDIEYYLTDISRDMGVKDKSLGRRMKTRNKFITELENDKGFPAEGRTVVELSELYNVYKEAYDSWEGEPRPDLNDMNESTEEIVIEAFYHKYERYESGGYARRRGKGKTEKEALLNLLDKLNAWIDSDYIQEEEEETGKELLVKDIIEMLEQNNGDGADFIIEMRNLTTGEVYINGYFDDEGDDLYEETSINTYKAKTDEEHIEEILSKGPSFAQQMVGRLLSDIKYFLGNGNRNEKHLWARNVESHINIMKGVHNGLEEKDKPDFITIEEIEDYEKQMLELNEDVFDKIRKDMEADESLEESDKKIIGESESFEEYVRSWLKDNSAIEMPADILTDMTYFIVGAYQNEGVYTLDEFKAEHGYLGNDLDDMMDAADLPYSKYYDYYVHGWEDALNESYKRKGRKSLKEDIDQEIEESLEEIAPLSNYDEIYNKLDDIGYRIFSIPQGNGIYISQKNEKNLTPARKFLDELGTDYEVKESRGRFFLEIPFKEDITEQLDKLDKFEPETEEDKLDDEDKEIKDKLEEEEDLGEVELKLEVETETVISNLIKLVEEMINDDIELEFVMANSGKHIPLATLRSSDKQKLIAMMDDERFTDIFDTEAVLETDWTTWSRIYVFKHVFSDQEDEELNTVMRTLVNKINEREDGPEVIVVRDDGFEE